MNRTNRILIGLATLWPIVYMILFFAFIILTVVGIQGSGKTVTADYFSELLILHVITILWIFALLTIYILHVFKNPQLRQEQKTMWAIVLFVGNIIAMPIYWYFYLRSNKLEAQA